MQQLPTLQRNPSSPAPTRAEIEQLSAEVRELAAQRNAVILAHNYQVPEVQDVADHMGDSLGLSRRAASTEADVIVFCGVHFMAETASILSPQKTVLIPDPNAGCSLSDSIDADQLRAWKAEHPGAVVVMYVNTSAEVKAETDYCCTSSNAVSVVEHIWAEHGPETEILFGPDMWLGSFVARETGLTEDPERYARFHVWDGECHVHAGIRPDDINQTRAEHPEADFLIHPECGCVTQVMEYVAAGDVRPEGVHILSTSGMLEHVHSHPEDEFVVATETGMLYPLHQAAPQANLIEANRMAFCKYMKMITLPKVAESLRELKVEVKVPEQLAERARLPIERMVKSAESGSHPLAPDAGAEGKPATQSRAIDSSGSGGASGLVPAASLRACSRWRRDWSSAGCWQAPAWRSSPAPGRAGRRWRPSASMAAAPRRSPSGS